ncbi:cytochrome P450 [Actinoallomurus iriomotensis]|uniref:cytochrome P450 n=1 Tax=Actinoallomurus iriomotensis TaxID=478107 RepID=UPI0025553AB0|nr:cytochrome P450 [Actinoallomurus iriomotensis]
MAGTRCISSPRRGRIYDRARALFGNGLATSDGAHHQRQRRLLQPAFHRDRVAGHAAIMGRHARELAESWRPGQLVSIDEAMHDLTLRTVVDALFSTELDQTVADEIRRLMPVIMNGIAVRMMTPKLMDRWPIPANRRFDSAALRLRQVVNDMIAAYRADGPSRAGLLSVLPISRDTHGDGAMTDDEACDELLSLLLAGTETPGNTLSWAMHEIARHPEVEHRLHEEIDAVLGTGPVTYADVAELEYTSRVLNETLRLHPVLMFTRRATTDTVLGGVHVPAGTEIAFSPYALYRDPGVFPQPTRFDPDRWLPDRAARLPRESFNPFGIGRHKCIGDTFAWTEMAITLATVAARWYLRPAEGHVVREIPAEVTRPNALPMAATPR